MYLPRLWKCLENILNKKPCKIARLKKYEEENNMIVINDKDLPITVAEKIISGTKTYDASPMLKALTKAITNDDELKEDMFSLDEIKEIADYLIVYYKSNENGD